MKLHELMKKAAATSIANKMIKRNELAKKMFGKKQIARVDRDYMKQVKSGAKNKTYGFSK